MEQAGKTIRGTEILDAVQEGAIQAGHSASYYYQRLNTALAFDTAVPFGLTARQQSAWLEEAGGRELMQKEIFDGLNVKSLPGGNTGAQMGGWFNKEIKSLDDLKGIPMRIPGLGGKVMNKLGVSALNTPGSEIYTSLQTGNITAAEWVGPYDDQRIKLNEVAEYYYFPRLVGTGAEPHLLHQSRCVEQAAADLPGGGGGGLQRSLDRHDGGLRRQEPGRASGPEGGGREDPRLPRRCDGRGEAEDRGGLRRNERREPGLQDDPRALAGIQDGLDRVAVDGRVRLREDGVRGVSGIVGIDLGGTRIKGLLLDGDSGEVLAEANRPTRLESAADGRPRWFHDVAGIAREWDPEDARPLGISAPGIGAPDERCILDMPGRLQALAGFDWTTQLERARLVPVLNDAQAALLGEVWLGAARGLRDAVMLTLGTGVGGAALVDGKLLKGHTGRGGHLGHVTVDWRGPPDICDTPGSLEDAIGTATLPRRSKGRFRLTADLLAAAAAGDAEAARVWEDSVRALAAALASLINVLDPETVILGGGIAEAGEALTAPLAAALDRCEWRPLGRAVPVVRARLGANAGAFGAAWNAKVKLGA